MPESNNEGRSLRRIFASNPSLRWPAIGLGVVGLFPLAFGGAFFLYGYYSWDFAAICCFAIPSALFVIAVHFIAFRTSRRLYRSQQLDRNAAVFIIVESLVANALVVAIPFSCLSIGTILSPTYQPTADNNSIFNWAIAAVAVPSVFFPANLICLILAIWALIFVRTRSTWTTLPEGMPASPESIESVAHIPSQQEETFKSYRLSQQGWLRYRSRLFRRLVLVGLISFSVAVIYSVILLGARWYQMWPILPLIVLAGGLGIFLSYRQQRKIWASVKLMLGEEFIARQQVRVAEVRLQRHEIVKIQDYRSGLLITTKDKFRSLIIPAELDRADFQDIKLALSKWKPIEPQPRSTDLKNIGLGIFLVVIYAVLVFPITYSLPAIVLAMVAALCVNGYYLWLMSRSSGVDPRFRIMFFVITGFILFIGAIKICALSGGFAYFMQTLTAGAR